MDAQSVIDRAVDNYFAYRTELNGREFKQLLREGRPSLIIGLSFLAACLSGAEMAKRFQIPGARSRHECLYKLRTSSFLVRWDFA